LITPIKSEAHWRSLRATHVGASEVAALWGEHPQISKFDLWHRKKGNIAEPNLSEDERVFWGIILEPAVAQGVAKIKGWQVAKVTDYYESDNCTGLGASLDFKISAPHRHTLGALEIKTADYLIWKSWEGTPPLNYELQVQHQLAATGWSWGALAVLIGGNHLEIFEYDARPGVIKAIEDQVAEFWDSITENVPPKPDWAVDYQTIAKVYGYSGTQESIDLSSNNRIHELIAERQSAADTEKDGKQRREAASAEIMHMMDGAKLAIAGDFQISIVERKGSPDRVITEKDVGTVIEGRAASRFPRVSKRKEKKDKAA
jgi:putative phage-type endonuclease